jgi:hypothetical protein
MGFFNLPEKAYFEQTEPISTLKHLKFWMFSFQILNQISQGNNMQHAAASNLHAILREVHVFLQPS